jgi:ectoine hydroxylase
MRLTPQQLEAFDREGYLFFPGLFAPEEVGTLTDAVRTNVTAHLCSKPFARLVRHPRRVEPVQQLFGDERFYMQQFKINGTMAFEGDVWQRHQDYGSRTNDECLLKIYPVDLPWRSGMPASAALTSTEAVTEAA